MEMPWLTAWSTAPCNDWLVMANVPRAMNPRWATDE